MSAIPGQIMGQGPSLEGDGGSVPGQGIQQPGQFDAPEGFKIIEPEIESNEYVPQPLERLHNWINSINIAFDLLKENKSKADELLNDLATKVVREYEIDEESREDWKKNIDKAMKIARQIIEEKNFPWPKAANVKFPQITIAAIQFAARAYAEIIKGNDVVKCRVKGDDPDGKKKEIGERVADHMSWQLTEEMEDWEEDTDKLLHVLPVVGFVFRKTYFDSILKRNVSEMVLPENFVVHYKTKNLATCRRGTEILTYYKNDIQGFVSSGQWIDPDIESLNIDPEHVEDSDPAYTFLEQHRWIDLDEDDYAEPYIVTVHKDSLKVVRIVARFDEEGIVTDGKKVIKIEQDQYYTKIPFIPAPDGSFYDIGFGVLLNATNESINTVINQLLDSGTLSNIAGGFISNAVQLGKKSGGTVTFKPNEWKQVNCSGAILKDSIFPFPRFEPSQVLFELLGLLIQAGKDLASVQDPMMGMQQPSNQPATTTLGLIEQGQQVFSAIHKRVYRSFKSEFKKIFALNAKYGKPKVEFHFKNKGQTVFDADYKEKCYDIVPVADPRLASDIQRIARAQATMSVTGRPHVDEDVLTSLMLDAVNPEHKNEILMPKEKWGAMPPPVPVREIMIREMELKLEAQKIAAQMHKIEADAILALARARDISDSDTMERLEMFLTNMDKERAREHDAQQTVQGQQAAEKQQQMSHQSTMEQQAAVQGMKK